MIRRVKNIIFFFLILELTISSGSVLLQASSYDIRSTNYGDIDGFTRRLINVPKTPPTESTKKKPGNKEKKKLRDPQYRQSPNFNLDLSALTGVFDSYAEKEDLQGLTFQQNYKKNFFGGKNILRNAGNRHDGLLNEFSHLLTLDSPNGGYLNEVPSYSEDVLQQNLLPIVPSPPDSDHQGINQNIDQRGGANFNLGASYNSVNVPRYRPFTQTVFQTRHLTSHVTKSVVSTAFKYITHFSTQYVPTYVPTYITSEVTSVATAYVTQSFPVYLTTYVTEHHTQVHTLTESFTDLLTTTDVSYIPKYITKTEFYTDVLSTTDVRYVTNYFTDFITKTKSFTDVLTTTDINYVTEYVTETDYLTDTIYLTTTEVLHTTFTSFKNVPYLTTTTLYENVYRTSTLTSSYEVTSTVYKPQYITKAVTVTEPGKVYTTTLKQYHTKTITQKPYTEPLYYNDTPTQRKKTQVNA